MLGHNRYSTNTWPSFKRVQPFGVLGHNGEINTIARLRQEARMMEVPLTSGGSDSQDLSRTIEALIYRQDLTLTEAMELVLPPIVDEIKGLPGTLRGFYMYLRQAFGPFAQGPVALISRFADEHVFSVDALGLRPLWQLETPEAWIFSSEPGVVAVADTVSEPKPLAPGEGAGGGGSSEVAHRSARSTPDAGICVKRWRDRASPSRRRRLRGGHPHGRPPARRRDPGLHRGGPSEPVKVEDGVLGGFGSAARGR